MTTTPPATYPALARHRAALYREAAAFADRVRPLSAVGYLSAESAVIADEDAQRRHIELGAALELAGIFDEATAQAAGLGYWFEVVLGVVVEVGEESR